MKRKDNLTSAFATNLQKVLKAKRLNAAQLARASSVSVASISRILAGKTNPSLTQVHKIAQVLEVRIDSLISPPTPSNIPLLSGLTEDELHAQQGSSKTVASPVAMAGQQAVCATYQFTHPLHQNLKDHVRLLENAAQGSWVDCWTQPFVAADTPKPQAIKARKTPTGVEVEMAFPLNWFEKGSATGVLSILSSPLTSIEATITQLSLPDSFKSTFEPCSQGIRGLREKMDIFGRPLLCATLRPMAGISPKIYGQMAYEALKGGVDFTCDPALLHSLPGQEWKHRFWSVADAVAAAAAHAEAPKDHAFNITAATVEEMLTRLDYVAELGGHMVLVDAGAIGLPALASVAQKCRKEDISLLAMGGRAVHRHVLAEHVQTQLLALAGADVISMPSPLTGEAENRRRVCLLANQLNDFSNQNPIFPAPGGGHNPWHFPRLVEALGTDVIIQCGGSVMGHPWGSQAGAKACRVAVEATIKAHAENLNLTIDGRSILQRAASQCKELEIALAYWKSSSFLFGIVQGAPPLTAHIEPEK